MKSLKITLAVFALAIASGAAFAHNAKDQQAFKWNPSTSAYDIPSTVSDVQRDCNDEGVNCGLIREAGQPDLILEKAM